MTGDGFLLFGGILVASLVIGTVILERLRRRRHPDAASYVWRFYIGLSSVMVAVVGIGISILIFESIIPTVKAVAMLLPVVLADAAFGLYGITVIRRGFRADRGAPAASR